MGIKCGVHHLEVMGLNPSQVELGVCSSSILVIVEPKISVASASVSKTAFSLQDSNILDFIHYIVFF